VHVFAKGRELDSPEKSGPSDVEKRVSNPIVIVQFN